MDEKRPRVLVVTGGRARGSLDAVRQFGRAGWVVGVGTPDGPGMVSASRWCQHQHRISRPRGNCDRFLADMQNTLSAQRYDLVFGGSDDYVAALAAHRDSFDAVIGHPDSKTVDEAMDKYALAQRAEAVGLCSPVTRLASDHEIETWAGPVVVKCRSHWLPGQTNVYRVESRRFSDIGSALDRVRAIRDAGFEPILQQPIDGRLGALSGVFRSGRLVGRVQHEAERVWPTPSGVSSRAVTVDVDLELVERCERLLDDLDWDGIVELQFLTDELGRRHLIDLNGRFYGSMALAIAAGVSMPINAARHVMGEFDGEISDARTGVRFSWIAGDLRRATLERRGGLVADVVSSLAWGRGAAKSVWDIRDLGPVRHLLAARMRAMTNVDNVAD